MQLQIIPNNDHTLVLISINHSIIAATKIPLQESGPAD
jgi:hypothetical protein